MSESLPSLYRFQCVVTIVTPTLVHVRLRLEKSYRRILPKRGRNDDDGQPLRCREGTWYCRRKTRERDQNQRGRVVGGSLGKGFTFRLVQWP